MPKRPVTSAHVEQIAGASRDTATDLVAVEEPLQILLEYGDGHERREAPLAVTMRTPGNDVDLVAGFLFTEGVISSLEDVLDVRHCAISDTPDNVVRARLQPSVRVPERLLSRALTVTSACGVCGERTLDALEKQGCAPLTQLPKSLHVDRVRRALASIESKQTFFRSTGGTHAAALFDSEGLGVLQREDVGRHNALDKLIGGWLRTPSPAEDSFLIVSSRASFELVQKTVRARFPVLIALGAASSLAIETAERFGVTLIGFAKNDRLNVYAGRERLVAAEVDRVFDVGAE